MSMQSFRIPQPSAVPFIPIMVGGEETGSEEIFEEVKETYQSIARRAYELHESRDQERDQDENQGEEGHGIADWLRAETELLIPVRAVIEETPRQVIVRALVLTFGDDEVLVHVEPHRIVIHGPDKPEAMREEDESREQSPLQYKLLHVIELPALVDVESARVLLDDGLLEVRLWKTLVF